MNETSNQTNTSKQNIYKNEKEIEEEIGERYNNTMCHRMKEKDTSKIVFPTYGLWKNELLFKTTNSVMVPSSYKDPYHDETYHFKMNFDKKFNEEMARAKNMMINKKKGDTVEKKKSSEIK